MAIYTKTGDSGTTALFGAGRVRKDDPRVKAYGAVDEANSIIGIARAILKDAALNAILEKIQQDLFIVGADLATPPDTKAKQVQRVTAGQVEQLEGWIDEQEAALPELTSFILPSGSPAGTHLHLARSVCRRAERETAPLMDEGVVSAEVLKYLNRLSDLLFMLARAANQSAGQPEVEWHPTQLETSTD